MGLGHNRRKTIFSVDLPIKGKKRKAIVQTGDFMYKVLFEDEETCA